MDNNRQSKEALMNPQHPFPASVYAFDPAFDGGPHWGDDRHRQERKEAKEDLNLMDALGYYYHKHHDGSPNGDRSIDAVLTEWRRRHGPPQGEVNMEGLMRILHPPYNRHRADPTHIGPLETPAERAGISLSLQSAQLMRQIGIHVPLGAPSLPPALAGLNLVHQMSSDMAHGGGGLAEAGPAAASVSETKQQDDDEERDDEAVDSAQAGRAHGLRHPKSESRKRRHRDSGEGDDDGGGPDV